MECWIEICGGAPNQDIIVGAEFGPPNCVTLHCNEHVS